MLLWVGMWVGNFAVAFGRSPVRHPLQDCLENGRSLPEQNVVQAEGLETLMGCLSPVDFHTVYSFRPPQTWSSFEGSRQV
jgi:hypothetical protein